MKKVVLKKTRSPSLNKALTNIEETLNGINDKVDELRMLDQGSKFFAGIGWLLMGLGGGGLLTVLTNFRNDFNPSTLAIEFLLSSLLIIIMIAGYMLSHKGLTGSWL